MDETRAELLSALQATGVIPPDADDDAAVADAAAAEAPEAEGTPAEDLETEAAEDDETAEAEDADEADDAEEIDAEEAEAEPDLEAIRAELEQLRREREEAKARENAWLLEQQRQQQDLVAQQWQQGEQALDGWLTDSLRTLANNRVSDERLIAESAAPDLLRAQLQQVRQQEEAWVWAQYRQQKQIYEQHKYGGYRAALEQAHIRGFAEKQLADYKLPAAELQAVMYYADGTPVDPNAYPARAAEIAARRNREKALKRQATQAQRSAKARELSGQSVTPGSGAAKAAPEFPDWRSELEWAATQLGFGPASRR